MRERDIETAIERYDQFLTDLYHERLNPKDPDYEEDFDSGYGDHRAGSFRWFDCY